MIECTAPCGEPSIWPEKSKNAASALGTLMSTAESGSSPPELIAEPRLGKARKSGLPGVASRKGAGSARCDVQSQ